MTPIFDDQKQSERFDEMRKREAEDLAKILSERYGVPYIDLSRVPINTEALRFIPEQKARQAGIALYNVRGKIIDAAILSPRNDHLRQLFEDIEQKNYKLNLSLASETSLERVWSRYEELAKSTKTESGLISISSETLEEFLTTIQSMEDIKAHVNELIQTKKNYGVSKLLEILLAGAIAVDSSDIHLEPEERSVRIRYRLDGVLHDIAFFPHESYKMILSRIKLISSLKLNIKATSQDGRFTTKLKGEDVEIRTSVTPSAFGEATVLRILNPKAIRVEFSDLGILPHLLSIIEREIAKPNGMVLVTGPTGSGKTTTLYAFLRKVNTPETKIITIEDPIEYHLKGISQTQVNDEKGYTFFEGLRSAVRQDPDIVMVGEIRDKETATTAINASLTGHLVFSTLHTNSAAGAVPRLIDLGVNPKIIASAINISLAQRLVRKLCEACKKEDIPTKEEINLIKELIQGMTSKEVENLPSEFKLFRGKGCTLCNGTGYRGRIGVYEGLLIDSEVERLTQENPSERELDAARDRQRTFSMKEDGVLKALRGITTLEEVKRVVEL